MRIIVGTAAIALALCFSQTSYGEESDLGEQENPTKNFNFTSNNTTQKTTVDPGKTDIIVTCFGLDEQQYAQKMGYQFNYECMSPETKLTCGYSSHNDHCICHNGTKESHTVNVTMDKHCDDPG